MHASPVRIPSPFADDKVELLSRLVAGLDNQALHWLAGYTAALATLPTRDVEAVGVVAAENHAAERQQLTILVGSQTGNARRLAESLLRDVENVGLNARLLRADDYPVRELKSERLLYVVISTQGDGDPPDDARGFIEFLTSKRAPRLENLKFSVLGLGDSSYAKFCSIGIDVDARLLQLGATRLHPRADADIDIETVAQPWLQQALTGAREFLKPTGNTATVTPLRPNRVASAWSRNHPFAAPVLVNQRISASNSGKDIRHLELSLRDSGLTYEPGDSVGVWPRNPEVLVEGITKVLHLDAKSAVSHANETKPLHQWLFENREITRLARPFVVAHAQRAASAELDGIVADPNAYARLLAEYQVIDLLHQYPAHWGATELVSALRPLTPRLYSIASSQKFVEDEAHLTVAHVNYTAFATQHFGAASNYLWESQEEASVPLYVQPNERFRVPTDASRDVIMIGPGTGVAPYRGFLQERTAVGASGRNWLFFGNPHSRSDFLYQLEWQRALKRGELHQLDLAFSRDQSEKIYVQHRIRAQGRRLHDWLEAGAHVYVCGDAQHMARDVHAALRDVVAQHAGISPEDAEAYLSRLADERRYARDVY